MPIKCYGLFLLADEVTWNPGRGHRGEFNLLGRRGKNRPGLRVADFRKQSGLYILYETWSSLRRPDNPARCTSKCSAPEIRSGARASLRPGR